MKFFIRIFIFLLIIAAAAYGYAWYKNKEYVSKFVSSMGGSFKSTYIDLNGDSVIKNLRMPVPMLDTETTIDEVRFGAGNPITNVKILRAFQSNQSQNLPDNFELYLKTSGEKTPLTSAYDQMSQALSNALIFQLPFLGCGDTKYLSSQDYFDQNINELTGESTYTFNFSKNNKVAYLDVYANYDNLQTMKGSLTIENLDINAPNPAAVKLGKAEIELGDNGIQAYILEKCANQMELSKSQFVERHISYLKHALFAENIFLSPQYYEEYAKYYANPRSMTFRFYPDNLNPTSLVGASPRRIISSLNTEVLINDKVITPLFGNRPDPSELPELDKVTPEDDGVTIVYGLKVQDTAVSEIGKYVGYEAYFKYRGQKYKGKIKSVRGNRANIRFEINAGNHVTQPFNTSDIRDLRIRREQTPPDSEPTEESESN